MEVRPIKVPNDYICDISYTRMFGGKEHNHFSTAVKIADSVGQRKILPNHQDFYNPVCRIITHEYKGESRGLIIHINTETQRQKKELY
jgi:hypothetical protein